MNKYINVNKTYESMKISRVIKKQHLVKSFKLKLDCKQRTLITKYLTSWVELNP